MAHTLVPYAGIGAVVVHIAYILALCVGVVVALALDFGARGILLVEVEIYNVGIGLGYLLGNLCDSILGKPVVRIGVVDIVARSVV